LTAKRKAILIALSEDIDEIKALAETLDYEIVRVFIQKREIPDVNTFVGRGKVEEIKEFLDNDGNNVDLVIVDGELKPSQWFNLEKEFGVEVYDRLRLILSIFEKRAQSKEAKLQVRLAQLRYERPFVRELIHRARAGEHPGFMAGGEYQVDDYYEMIKRQTKKLKLELEKIRRDREIRRKHRRESGFYLIALAGYTNAGKSSLLNLLTGEKVKVEELLFSTLSTKTSKLKKGSAPPILLTDTVGFIRNLPSWVIDAFHSTLEEISVADLILLVVDVSEDVKTVREKLETCLNELKEIGANVPVIVVFNKIDKVSPEELKTKLDSVKDLLEGMETVEISVREKKNIDRLLEAMSRCLPSPINVKMILPNIADSHRFIADIFDRVWIKSIEYGNSIKLDVSMNPRIAEKLLHRCKEIGGKIIRQDGGS